VPIIDADEYDGQIVIVSEYAPDGSLEEWLKKHGAMPVERAIETTIQILDGLEFLHSRNIIHRDLKPANILLQGKTPRLADFGISRALRTTVASQSQNISGTFAYMSPEALDGKRSVQTDVWSVGVNLYQFLTGTLPFPQKEPSVLFPAIIMREFTPLPDSIPQSLKTVIAKALAKLPENRYKTTGEMREDLRKILIRISFPHLAITEVLPESITNPVIIETKKGSVANTKPANHLTGMNHFYMQDSVVTQLNEKESIIARLKKSIVARLSVVKLDTVERKSIQIEFVYIPPGEFIMGSTRGGADQKPAHKVTIGQGFWMGKTEVTQAQWESVIGTNPSYFKDCPQCPVEMVSWDDVQSFISRLNAQNDGFKYRLPSEAEWEYATRTGTQDDYIDNLNLMAVYRSNSDSKTHPVATKQPNNYGLYDMYGNVWEWCEDWFGDYPNNAIVNPMGATSGI
jgi:formylglycine-generating enzyme required for sulfatase activity